MLDINESNKSVFVSLGEFLTAAYFVTPLKSQLEEILKSNTFLMLMCHCFKSVIRGKNF